MIAAVLIACVLVLAPAAASAQTDTTPSPSTTLFVAEGESNSIIPQPNSGRAPQQPGDRGGWLQTVTFLLVIGGMGTVVGVIARATAKKTRAAKTAMESAERAAQRR
jgi:hypothetical protein